MQRTDAVRTEAKRSKKGRAVKPVKGNVAEVNPALRNKGKRSRRAATDAMQAKGAVRGWQFAAPTNAMYREFFGGPAEYVRRALGLGPRDNIRDHLSPEQCAAIAFCEQLAAAHIMASGDRGSTVACAIMAKMARLVADLMHQAATA